MDTPLSSGLRQSATIDSYLQAAADMTADLIEVVWSYSLSTSLYGRPINVGTSDHAAWEAGAMLQQKRRVAARHTCRSAISSAGTWVCGWAAQAGGARVSAQPRPCRLV